MSGERVAVIGAGLAGSVAAWHLARRGVAPVLFEREAEPGARAACGGLALAALAEQLDLDDEVVGHRLARMRVATATSQRLVSLARPLFISFDRGRLDAAVAARAVAEGAELRRSCQVTGWDPTNGRVAWRCAGERRSEVFETVVLADGWRTVGSAAGLGVAPTAATATAFYRELEDGDRPVTDAAEFTFGLDADDPGYFWVFPKRGSTQVGVGRVEPVGEHSPSRVPLRALLDEFINRDPRLAGLRRLRSHGGVLPLELAATVACPGGLVVGDAAGLVNPLTGSGLIYAVASGEMAARAILEGRERGCDRDWVARRYRRLLHRSPHHWYLRVQGVPFRLVLRRIGTGGSFPFGAMVVLFASIMPRLASVARVVTKNRGRAHGGLHRGR